MENKISKEFQEVLDYLKWLEDMNCGEIIWTERHTVSASQARLTLEVALGLDSWERVFGEEECE